jgi:hypothetical protein
MRAEELRIGRLIGPVVVDIEGAFSGEDDSFEVDFPRRGAGGRLVLVQDGRPHAVVSVGMDAQVLERLAGSTAPTVSWASRIDEHTALVEVRVLDGELVTGMQVFSIADEVAEELLTWLGVDYLADDAVIEEFVLPDAGSGERHIISSSTSTDEIEIVGRTCRLRVDTTAGLRVIGFVPSALAAGHEMLRLARGGIELTDGDPVDSPLLGSLATSTAPLFELWETYNRLELEAAQDRAAQIGQARHGKPDYRDDDLVILPIRAAEDAEFLKELSRERSGTEVEIIPSSATFDADTRSLNRFVGTVEHVDVAGKTISVRPRRDRPGVITADGLLRPYLGGAAAQAKRREAVFSRLQCSDHGIESLGYLLREERPLTTPKPKHRPAITDAVRKIIPGTITPAQQRAIDVAINTPDIALIQGPPGTGKSQVIAAIQQRLAELAPGEKARLILLTSVQHDAVDLVAARTNIFGLPARRVAPRRSDVESPIEKWRQERLAALRRYNSTRERSLLSRWLGDVLDVYERTPYTPASAADLLEEVVDRCGGELDAALRERMEKRAESLRLQRNRSRLAADLRAVRGLRTTAEGHDDDGPRQAERLLRRRLTTIEGWNHLVAPVLERVADGASDLETIARIRSLLLDELLRSETIGGAALADEQTRLLLTEAKAKVAGSRDLPLTPEEAVDLFMLDLELDEYGVEQAISGYTAVWASTCQGSATLFVGDLSSNQTAIPFPIVIVDEAARANPLDLLIPMVQAGERIILVGDHRQLPQLVDDALQKRVGEEHTDQDAALLEDSLFHRLFRHLERLEAETGIPRAVSLDVQFRMHPTLGDFVSKVFYEPHGEGFRSGRSADDFDHGISRFRGQVAAWVDVPAALGPPKRSGTSLFRPAEAKTVAHIAAEILSEAPDLSVGIITFYAAQQERILEELADFGITELSEDGISIAAPYRMLETASGRREERLRVGTVDSFQGKEFDAVILSMVRSGAPRAGATVRETFGFLTSENRTCVALSRQRRLLVVVGDRRLADLPNAEHVRGLVELADLCGAPQ